MSTASVTASDPRRSPRRRRSPEPRLRLVQRAVPAATPPVSVSFPARDTVRIASASHFERPEAGFVQSFLTRAFAVEGVHQVAVDGYRGRAEVVFESALVPDDPRLLALGRAERRETATGRRLVQLQRLRHPRRPPSGQRLVTDRPRQ